MEGIAYIMVVRYVTSIRYIDTLHYPDYFYMPTTLYGANTISCVVNFLEVSKVQTMSTVLYVCICIILSPICL